MVRLVGKRGRERVVPLDTEILPALAAWRDIRPVATTNCLFTSLPVVKGSQPGPLDARDIGRIIEKYATAAGLPPEFRGAHVLRHTFATALRRNGAALDAIRALRGHDDIRTTRIYAKVAHAGLEGGIDAKAARRSAGPTMGPRPRTRASSDARAVPRDRRSPADGHANPHRRYPEFGVVPNARSRVKRHHAGATSFRFPRKC